MQWMKRDPLTILDMQSSRIFEVVTGSWTTLSADSNPTEAQLMLLILLFALGAHVCISSCLVSGGHLARTSVH